MNHSRPRMMRVRQNFPPTPPLDLRATLREGFAGLQSRVQPGARIAVGVGSRGITNLPAIIQAVLDQLKDAILRRIKR